MSLVFRLLVIQDKQSEEIPSGWENGGDITIILNFIDQTITQQRIKISGSIHLVVALIKIYRISLKINIYCVILCIRI